MGTSEKSQLYAGDSPQSERAHLITKRTRYFINTAPHFDNEASMNYRFFGFFGSFKAARIQDIQTDA